MDTTLYIPILVEATKFVFNQLGKWADHARQRIGKQASDSADEKLNEEVPKLTRQDFAKLEMNPQVLISTINVNVAHTNVYIIKGLVEQLEIHYRNLTDLEGVEAEFGSLTPLHVKRGIEREANAIVEKSENLKDLISQVYGRIIEDE